eukprot:scaffold128093_cov63-Phaeocystis_antarctica.AAC.4
MAPPARCGRSCICCAAGGCCCWCWWCWCCCSARLTLATEWQTHSKGGSCVLALRASRRGRRRVMKRRRCRR